VVSCTPGELVSLPCTSSTPVSWSRFDSPTLAQIVDIYVDGNFVDGFSEGFSLSRPDSSGYGNLSIVASEESDSGLYVCVENNGLGRPQFVRLYVTSGELSLVDRQASPSNNQ